MENSSIAWTDHTLNFWHGCFKVSAGCQNCYAETLSKRYGRDIWGPAKITTRIRTIHPWKDCLRWDKKAKAEGVHKRVFVMSVGDFLEDHPQVAPWREEAAHILESFEWMDVLLLTKRPENAKKFLPTYWFDHWPEHIWFGVSVENQEAAEARIPALLTIPTRVHWLSIEPMLGPVDLTNWLQYLDWVIIGGESGAKCRPMELGWARDVLHQCQTVTPHIPYFFKQVGGHPKKFDQMENFPEDLRTREYPR